MKTVTCAYCGKEKILTNEVYNKSKKKGNKNFYCNPEHFYIHIRTTKKVKTITCDHCKKKFQRHENLIRHTKNYCGMPCRIKAKKPKTFTICPCCKKRQHFGPAEKKRRKTKYCSKCYNSIKNRERNLEKLSRWKTCENCGKQFYQKKYAKNTDGCSPKCKGILYGRRVLVKCTECGKERFALKVIVDAAIKLYHQDRHWFCDKKCYEKWRKGKELLRKWGSKEHQRASRALKINFKTAKDLDLFTWLEIHSLYVDLKKSIKEVRNGSSKIRKVRRHQKGTQASVQRPCS